MLLPNEEIIKMSELFCTHKNGTNIFIETGTSEGRGIDAAILAGFTEIFSVEVKKPLFDKNVFKYRHRKNIHLFNGTSERFLTHIIGKLNCQLFFWLDAHDSKCSKISKCPILEEIKIIGKSIIKNHTLLIDDVRIFKDYKVNDLYGGISFDQVQEAVLKINPNYVILFDNSDIYVNDVLIAKTVN